MKDDDDSNLETLFKMRVDSDRVKSIKELMILFLLLVGFFLGLIALASAQYFFVCTANGRDVSFLQCIRGDYLVKKK